MILSVRLAVLVLLSAFPLSSFSKELSCGSRGVTLSVPDDWTVNDSRCLFSGPNDLYIAEINPAGKETGALDITLVSNTAVAVLKAGLKYEEYGRRVEVDLPNSRGIQRTFKDTAGRNIVQVVLERDGRFWQLILQTPSEVWSERKAELLEILHSAKVGAEVQE